MFVNISDLIVAFDGSMAAIARLFMSSLSAVICWLIRTLFCLAWASLLFQTVSSTSRKTLVPSLVIRFFSNNWTTFECSSARLRQRPHERQRYVSYKRFGFLPLP